MIEIVFAAILSFLAMAWYPCCCRVRDFGWHCYGGADLPGGLGCCERALETPATLELTIPPGAFLGAACHQCEPLLNDQKFVLERTPYANCAWNYETSFCHVGSYPSTSEVRLSINAFVEAAGAGLPDPGQGPDPVGTCRMHVIFEWNGGGSFGFGNKQQTHYVSDWIASPRECVGVEWSCNGPYLPLSGSSRTFCEALAATLLAKPIY